MTYVDQPWTLHAGQVWSGRYLASDPSVIFDDGVYRMFYTDAGLDPDRVRPVIAEAISTNGIDWTPVSTPMGSGIVVSGVLGGERANLEGAEILKTDAGYILYFSAYADDGYPIPQFPAKLYVATSADGVNFTQMSDEPVLAPTAGWYDRDAVFSPTVIAYQGEYLMVYAGHSLAGTAEIDGREGTTLLTATSTDGLTWTKSEQPLLRADESIPWMANGAAEPSLIEGPDGKLYLFFTGLNGDERVIGLATADSLGGPWTIRPEPIIYAPQGGLVIAPEAEIVNGVVRLWYTSVTADDVWSVSYAESAWTPPAAPESGQASISGSAASDTILYDPGAVLIEAGEQLDGSDQDMLVLTTLEVVDLGAAEDQVAGGGIATGFEGVDFSRLGAEVAFTGDGQNNRLIGTRFADRLGGGDGADTLSGGAGADTLVGGAGDDVLVFDDLADTAIELAGEGRDLIRASVSASLPEAVEDLLLVGLAGLTGSGNQLANALTGNSGANVLLGEAGNDTLDGGQGVDTLRGGEGDDLYLVEQASDWIEEGASAGFDTVRAAFSYVLGAHLEAVQLMGSASIDAAGNELDNVITGNDGDNVLDGASGADRMAGGRGDDIFRVDDARDQVFEAEGEGSDLVLAQASFALQVGQEVEQLSLDPGTGAQALDLRGNEFANMLVGNAGANLLDGGGGADDLRGLEGDDTYWVDNPLDHVTELAGGGRDTVITTDSYVLDDTTEVETLRADNAASRAALYLGGSHGANVIIGNAGDNVLDGRGGADQMEGLGGNDIYVVDDALDQVLEAVGAGQDVVISGVSFALGASAEVEVLATTDDLGWASIDLAGSNTANWIIGNAGRNVLSGGLGSDTLTGLGGDDVLIGGSATGGTNQLLGGTGVDTASYEGATEVIHADLRSNTGRVGGLLTDLMSSIENLIGGSGNDVLIGADAGGNVLAGGDGDDALYGLGGDDLLLGGAVLGNGRNQLWGGSGLDTASYEGSASDRYIDLRSQAGYLKAGSSLVLTDTMNSIENATGGAGADTLIGSNVANLLTGGAGSDVLKGLDGDDVLRGGVGNDQLWGGAGLDWADYSDQALAITINLGNQTGSGAGAGLDTFNLVENARGGAGIDTIRGSNLNNVIEGGGARDILYGLAGADTFVYRAASDSRLSTGYDTIADFLKGTDKIDLAGFSITPAQVLIQSAGAATSLYADIDGVAGFGPNDLAIAFTGANAVTVGDILF